MKKINVLLSTFLGYGYLTKIPGTVTSAVTAVLMTGAEAENGKYERIMPRRTNDT